VLVWEERGIPQGFGVLQIVGEEAYIVNIMVDPARRRQGHGSTLLQKVIIEARDHGARRLVLDVDAANGAALALYKNAGFEILERRRAAYPRGEDAIVMKKDL
jgi:[ribosomal protein S18]-alanine N-acetyltransferase